MMKCPFGAQTPHSVECGASLEDRSVNGAWNPAAEALASLDTVRRMFHAFHFDNLPLRDAVSTLIRFITFGMVSCEGSQHHSRLVSLNFS